MHVSSSGKSFLKRSSVYICFYSILAIVSSQDEGQYGVKAGCSLDLYKSRILAWETVSIDGVFGAPKNRRNLAISVIHISVLD